MWGSKTLVMGAAGAPSPWTSFLTYYYIIYTSLVYFTMPASGRLSGNETDRLALLDFKEKITSDPYGVMSSWNKSVPLCKWYGVTCGQRHQRVIELNLHSLQLAGTISPHIGNLSFLKTLDLKNNSLSHQIPHEIGNCQRLHTLYLYNNSLSGEIPSNLSRCSKLTVLSLVNNKLVGKIPKELGSLSKLQFLSLSVNNLIGEIPLSLGNLSSLKTLSAEENNFVGNIPDSLGQLKQLTFLGIGLNRLSGTVPSSIFNLSSLELMEIGRNQLRGSLPADLFITLPNLHTLNVAWSHFTGPIPTSLSNASNLQSLQFQKNKFVGRVPPLEKLNELSIFLTNDNSLGNGGPEDLSFLCSLSNATNLQILDISNNYLGGDLPGCISNLSTKLAELSLKNNQISGSIPAGIQNIVSLTIIQVFNNTLSGKIPETLGNLENLVELILDQKQFTGAIPASLGKLSKLNRLHIADNRLEGSIPSSLGNCTYLQLLDLSRNKLSGTLPPEVIGLTSLSIYLGFAQNQLTGPLPTEVGRLKDLGILDVSDNKLSGEIPSSLGSCLSLEYLYMMGNFFQGPIPSTLSSLRGLQVLNISHNNLSSKIPDFLGSFKSLLYLDMSYNDFDGIVPTDGVFANASAITLVGNSKLCAGISELHLPLCDLNRRKKKRLSSKAKLAIAFASSLLGVILISLVYLLCLLKYKKKQRISKSATTNTIPSLLQLSYQDLHRATDSFSLENLVGEGSFASVYKGILHDRSCVAVKVLKLQHHAAAKSFMVECEALRSIRHRNLIKVITACSSIDYQGNDFKALVYEFMPNGSLEEWLHPSVNKEENEEESKSLNLHQRLNIAHDVASALEYLHHECGTPIVHCDLKPSNILLDNELNGHVGDFGIAKFLVRNIDSNSSDTNLSTIGLRGTIGYAPPEYGVGSEVSIRGDIYSYGILLLEMLTGKRPTDGMFKDGLSLYQYVTLALPNRVAEIIDQTLAGEMGTSKEDQIMDSLTTMFRIGLACSAESPGERMNISDVIKKLCVIKKKLHEGQDTSRERALEVQGSSI